jgi:hypothetical protein
MSNESSPQSEIILYQTEDGRTRIQCRLEDETVWLTQALIASLFDKDVRTINEHLVNIFDEEELSREATIRKFRMVRTEGKREVMKKGKKGARIFSKSPFGVPFQRFCSKSLANE